MKPARVVWRPEAIAERVAIMDYIAQDSPLAAIDLDEEIEVKADALLKHPTLYKPGRIKGTREMVVRPNFIVVYELDGADVVILNVLHAAQQWPPGVS
ncbi:type II toxin-antitoxin system RelE/ParE family toxin [Pollutimonas bauzanensis]|nr:type II toxin-antitoxin system RelE/ParE family toxin [Pollutimonas bauzanensis]